jgi:hypothetical protein
MARPTIKGQQARIASIQAHRARQVESLGQMVRNQDMIMSDLGRRVGQAEEPRDQALGRLLQADRANAALREENEQLRGTTVGAGGATDNAINTAKSWFGDLGRNSAGYDLRNKPRETLWERPLGGYGQAFLENVGMPAGQAQVGERLTAAALSSVVGIPALMAAYDGLFGQSQSIGTLPVTDGQAYVATSQAGY